MWRFVLLWTLVATAVAPVQIDLSWTDSCILEQLSQKERKPNGDT